MRAVGMTWQRWHSRHTACRTKPLQANTAGGLSARHRPQRNNQQMAGLTANNNSRRRCRLASRCAVQVGGGSAKVLALRKAGADRPNLSLPHLSPLPCHPHCLHQRSCPRSVHFALPPVHFHVLQDHHTNSLHAARLSCWQLQHGPAVAARAPVSFDSFFFLQSP